MWLGIWDGNLQSFGTSQIDEGNENMRTLLINLIWLVLTIGLCTSSATCFQGDREEDGRDETPSLPQIWGEQQFGGELSGAFRILSELQLPQSNASYILEEWADGSRELFRMDVTNVATSRRSSILAYGMSYEKHFFEPFTCSAIVDLVKPLGEQLAEKFPKHHKFVLGGLGSVWLFASTPENSKNLLFVHSNDSLADKPAAKRTVRRVLRQFDQFHLKPTTEFPFGIRFYFHESAAVGEETINPEALVALHLTDQETKKVVVRFRVIEMQTSRRAQADQVGQPELFELPVGYGCTKPQPLPVDASLYSPPANCFLVEATPRIFQLEAITSVPGPDPASQMDIDKWSVHSSSLRFVTGRLQNRNEYLVVERSDFVGPSSRLRRLKRVWDLGINLNDTSGAEDKLKLPPVYFELDETKNKCVDFNDRPLDSTATLEFNLSNRTECLIGVHSAEPLVRVGLALHLDSLQRLFEDTIGFYLVRKTQASWLRYSELVHERRLDDFELFDRRGNLVWLGPVSIVRHSFVIHANFASGPTDQTEPLELSLEDQKVRVSVHLLSKDYSRLLGIINLILSPGRLIDVAYFHRELNVVGACLGNDPRRRARLQDFRLEYPIELESSDSIGALIGNGRPEELIYDKFLHSLTAVTGGQMDPLQLINLQFSIDKELVVVSGQFVDWPHLLDFHRRFGLKFASAEAGGLFRELKPNQVECAESCAHLNCLMFTYCQNNNLCQLYLRPADQTKMNSYQVDQLPLGWMVADAQCNAFIKRVHRQHPVGSREFLHIIRSEILSDSVASPSKLNLELEISAKNDFNETSTVKVLLKPTRVVDSNLVDHSLEPLNETGDVDPSSDDLTVVRPTYGPEYELVLENQRLKWPGQPNGDFPVREANHMDYEACEQFCEENDCLSFSHCQLEATCLVSRLHRTQSIKERSQRAELCRVVARDYSSKFQMIPQMVLPKRLVVDNKLQLESSRDCAIHCAEETRFRCRSFYFCPPIAESFGLYTKAECLLRSSRHLEDPLDVIADSDSPNGSGDAGGQTLVRKCDYFTSSYLMEFDRFYGKQLVEDEEARQIILKDVGAELCSAECAELEACQAFHVCVEPSTHRPTCAISHRPIDSRPLTPSKDFIEAKQCTTFLRTSGAKLDKIAADYVNTTELRPVAWLDVDQLATERNGGNSGWFASIATILMGLATGYSLAWLLAVVCWPRFV